jgi:hypothetical protein
MMQAGMYWMEDPKFYKGTSQNGKAYFCLEGAITHRYEGGQPYPLDAPQQRTIFFYISTDKSIEISEAKLVGRCGWNMSVDAPAFKWTGKDGGLEVECRIESYEGKAVERWDIAGSGASYEHKCADDAKHREVLNRWLAKSGKPAAATPPPSRGPVPVSAPMRQREPGDEGDGDLAF